MSEEKQIEELANSFYEAITHLLSLPTCRVLAKDVIGLGYRKQSEVIDEFVDRLKEAPIKCGLPLLGLSTKGEIEEYFNGIMLQVRDVIDNIAKEMKGGVE